RGIDVNDLPYVVNYDLPSIPNDYVYRIGRTGRAGKEGNAISFFSADDGKHLRAINQLTKLSLRPEVLEGFEPSFDPNKSIKKLRSPSKGKKKSKRYFGKARKR
ncbi:MAG: helicase-related protein, partial [Luminiphilus sp.]